MKTKLFLLKDKEIYWLISGISMFLFIGIYGIRILNPVYVDWLLTGGDLTQHYLGWRAYRENAWHFPIGMVDNLAYPNLTSVIFTDSIPVFAVLFKLISPILPSQFQYFGIWGAMCFILQGVFTGKILKKCTTNTVIIIIGAVLTILTPVMICRMYAHTSLAGQWIIIYSLGIIIDREKYKSNNNIYIHIALIAILSSSIHIYFVLMDGMIVAGMCLLDSLENRRILRNIGILTEYIIVVAFVVGLLGGFSSGMAAKSEGLGIYSINLNVFFNSQGWSCVLKNFPSYGGGQYEGFGYLGLGFIFLLFTCLALLAGLFDWREVILKHGKMIVSFTIVFIVAFIVALSPVITYGDKLLAEISLPEFIIARWAIFRASGRVIWVCIYIIEICIFIILNKGISISRLIVAILSIALILQIFDIHKVLAQKHEHFAEKLEYHSALETEEFWSSIGGNFKIKHIVYYNLPDQVLYYSLTDWALSNDKTVSDFYFARSIDDAVNESRDKALEKLPEDCIFVFPESDIMSCLNYDLNYYYVDGLVVGYTDEIESYQTMEDIDK